MCAAKFRKKERKNKKPVQKTRKEKRKEKRLEKKQGRNAFYQNKIKKEDDFEKYKGKNQALIKGTELKKKNPSDGEPIRTEVKMKKNIIHDKLKKQQELDRKREKKLRNEISKQKKKQLAAAALEDDRTIKQAEKFLRMNKRKNKNLPTSFMNEGIDYILDMCDEEKRKIVAETEKQLLGVDPELDFQEDFDVATGQTLQKTKKKQKSEDKINSDASENMSDHEIDFSPDSKKLNEMKNKQFQAQEESSDNFEYSDSDDDDLQSFLEESDDGKNSQSSDNDNSECPDSNDDNSECSDNIDEDVDMNNSEEIETEEENSKNWEDIYGRTRDKDGNVVSNRYVPPAVRVKNLQLDSQNSEKLIQLKRQLKGPLNRLTDRNMHTISSQIEELYQRNSRNDMNEMLTKLIIEALVMPTMTPDRLIIEHMMLVAVLHANVDSEVGSQFLLTLVKRIHETLDTPQTIENKQLDNLILMLSHLYNFKVFGSKLIYEILEKLSEKFTEKEIDLILLILKNAGFPLRKDDPIALKELIVKLQKMASDTKCVNSRVRFMLDILLAIKNNNVNKIPQYDPSVMDQMKKHIKTLIRKGNSISQLNITLDDLLNADERGKWWIVGAAWTGNLSAEKVEKTQNKPKYSEKLLELAHKQRMNTDIRRNIFCILMSAENFSDAFEKLQHLGLKAGQEKEIIYVLMNCCLQENNFNPYYAVLAQTFCDYDRKYQMTIQYTLWDKFKTLHTFNNRQIKNLALFLTHLFLHRGLSISTMKVIQLDELDKPKMKLLRQVLLGIIMHENSANCLAVFERITRSENLNNFREALKLFITQFVVKNVEVSSIENDKLTLIKERTEIIDRILSTRGSRIVF